MTSKVTAVTMLAMITALFAAIPPALAQELELQIPDISDTEIPEIEIRAVPPLPDCEPGAVPMVLNDELQCQAIPGPVGPVPDCEPGEVPRVVSGQWECRPISDTPPPPPCEPDEIPVKRGPPGPIWFCEPLPIPDLSNT